MKLKLYNSLSKSIEEFVPVEDNIVRIYSCGPTVYNFAHIGNLRSFLFADMLQKVLRVVGKYDVKWVMNITDIDDKTIRDSKIGSKAWLEEMGKQTDSPKENLRKFTEVYFNYFIDDISKIGIDIEDFYAIPFATDFIEEMQSLILKIFNNGFAYISDGSIYFNVSKWREVDKYGKLYNIDFENFKKGQRVDTDEYEKENISDFVLWKGYKEGEPYWDFIIDGVNYPGRPGWHIECSAMEYELLSLPFDIHTGGIDLKFPHHEDEIAQSKAGYGIEPTKYWLHNEFLEVEGQKMSKSLGNFYTLRDLLKKGIDPLDIRFAMLSAHYRTKYNFTFSGIESAKKARNRIQELIYDIFESPNGTISYDVEKLKLEIFSHLADDLHTPKALATLFTFINENNVVNFDDNSKNHLLALINELNYIFGVWEIEKRPEANIEIPYNVKEMAEQRWQFKLNKNYVEADKLRIELDKLGYIIKDSKDSYIITKK